MLLRRLQRLATASSALRRGRGGADDVIPILKRKVSNSWSAVQDTYFSTKDIFERHKVVFTISTSVASILTAWTGYTLRHYHQSNVERRLDSIERAMKYSSDLKRHELKQIVGSGNVSTTTCVATAFTTFAVRHSTTLTLLHCIALAFLIINEGLCVHTLDLLHLLLCPGLARRFMVYKEKASEGTTKSTRANEVKQVEVHEKTLDPIPYLWRYKKTQGNHKFPVGAVSPLDKQ